MKKMYRGGCACCPKTEDELPLDTVLYNAFGGYRVYKNKKLYFCEDPAEHKAWEDNKKLSDLEAEVIAAPKARWQIVLDLPLRGAVWNRKGHRWVLVSTNRGFA